MEKLILYRKIFLYEQIFFDPRVPTLHGCTGWRNRTGSITKWNTVHPFWTRGQDWHSLNLENRGLKSTIVRRQGRSRNKFQLWKIKICYVTVPCLLTNSLNYPKESTWVCIMLVCPPINGYMRKVEWKYGYCRAPNHYKLGQMKDCGKLAASCLFTFLFFLQSDGFMRAAIRNYIHNIM